MKLAPWIPLALLLACSSSDDKKAPAASQDVDGDEPGGVSSGDDDGDDDGNGADGNDDAGPDEPDPDPSGDAGPPGDDDDPDPDPVVPDGGRVDDGLLADGGVSICGDGVLDYDNDEECEPGEPPPVLCTALGFTSGEISCTEECRLVITDCVGVEECTDGRDNDGDFYADCDDEDCSDACADACSNVVDIATVAEEGEMLRIEGSTLGHEPSLDASCTEDGGAGEVVYRYVPRFSGLVEVVLESGALLVASIRSSCDAVDSELACGLIGTVVAAETRRDEPLFIAVDGRTATDQGTFVMSLSERRTGCGDGRREPNEQCDDGNQNEADGCTAECSLQPTETEPNDTVDDANDFVNPHYAEIAPATDVDVIRFEVPLDAGVTVRVIDLDDESCSLGTMDPLLRIYDEFGGLAGEDDDGGDGYCPLLPELPLGPGSYTAEVSRVSAGDETFPYRLVINQIPVEE